MELAIQLGDLISRKLVGQQVGELSARGLPGKSSCQIAEVRDQAGNVVSVDVGEVGFRHGSCTHVPQGSYRKVGRTQKFCNRDQPSTAAITSAVFGLEESNISAGRVSYELRRLRLHGLIERIEGTHQYRLTPEGLATAVFYQRTYARIIRPGLSVIPSTPALRTCQWLRIP